MTNVFFRPWVGENYKTKGFNGKRILVLGESCYCGMCPDCVEYDLAGDLILPEKEEGKEFETCRDKIPEVVTKFLANQKGATYRKFTDVFMGYKCTPDETQTFWNSIVFYNYVQTAPEKARIALKPLQWETGQKPFFEVLAEYNPDVVIAWSKELWNKMPTGFREDKSFLNRFNPPAPLRYYNNGKRDIPVYGCYHPSTSAFSNEDIPYFKRLLEKV